MRKFLCLRGRLRDATLPSRLCYGAEVSLDVGTVDNTLYNKYALSDPRPTSIIGYISAPDITRNDPDRFEAVHCQCEYLTLATLHYRLTLPLADH